MCVLMAVCLQCVTVPFRKLDQGIMLSNDGMVTERRRAERGRAREFDDASRGSHLCAVAVQLRRQWSPPSSLGLDYPDLCDSSLGAPGLYRFRGNRGVDLLETCCGDLSVRTPSTTWQSLELNLRPPAPEANALTIEVSGHHEIERERERERERYA